MAGVGSSDISICGIDRSWCHPVMEGNQHLCEHDPGDIMAFNQYFTGNKQPMMNCP
jgi:ribosomal protein L31